MLVANPSLVRVVAQKPIAVPVGRNATLTLFPEEESASIRATLAIRSDRTTETRAFDFPVSPSNPTRVLAGRFGSSDVWLVLAITDTVRNTFGFCLSVAPKRRSVRLLFTDHSNMRESRASLRRGAFYESNYARWIFLDLPRGASEDDLYFRTGKYQIGSDTVVFSPWKKQKGCFKGRRRYCPILERKESTGITRITHFDERMRDCGWARRYAAALNFYELRERRRNEHASGDGLFVREP